MGTKSYSRGSKMTSHIKEMLTLVGKDVTCCICKNKEPKYFMNRTTEITNLSEELKSKNTFICDTCLS